MRFYELTVDPDPILLASGGLVRGETRGRAPPVRDSLELARSTQHQELEASTPDSLGYIAQHTGDLPTALSYFNEAIEVYRRHGLRRG